MGNEGRRRFFVVMVMVMVVVVVEVGVGVAVVWLPSWLWEEIKRGEK